MQIIHERAFVPYAFGTKGYAVVAEGIATEFVSELRVALNGEVLTVRHVVARREWEIAHGGTAVEYAQWAAAIRRHMRRQIMREVEKKVFGE